MDRMELRGKKRFWSKAERLQMVEESLQPGASTSVVARSHDINSNQLFHWRKQYREGYFNGVLTPALVAVRVSESSSKVIATARRGAKSAASSGTIEIEIGAARVRIEGAADPACVRATIEGLLR